MLAVSQSTQCFMAPREDGRETDNKINYIASTPERSARLSLASREKRRGWVGGWEWNHPALGHGAKGAGVGGGRGGGG